ncbi:MULTISPECIES: hypothetical protein [unclassified Mesorhizobium]|uniref:hypothetical protein n=1 Tax=unclassified Mesorhizobium TaxID=325217 RepID=UPI0003CFFBE2|nr:hypothetical protein [Mesorhizobium sp. L48C026A00]ESZ04461.1 hypothetical protein X737_36855 [Mesorhizobium sp. L48C026A00]
MTKPALYVEAGLPLMDKGQQAFERRIKKVPGTLVALNQVMANFRASGGKQ